jgi:hypothetical protein
MNQPRGRAIVARHVSFVLAAAVVVCVQATVCLSDGAETICEHPVVKHAFLQSMMCENPSALNCAEQGISTAKALKSMTDQELEQRTAKFPDFFPNPVNEATKSFNDQYRKFAAGVLMAQRDYIRAVEIFRLNQSWWGDGYQCQANLTIERSQLHKIYQMHAATVPATYHGRLQLGTAVRERNDTRAFQSYILLLDQIANVMDLCSHASIRFRVYIEQQPPRVVIDTDSLYDYDCLVQQEQRLLRAGRARCP